MNEREKALLRDRIARARLTAQAGDEKHRNRIARSKTPEDALLAAVVRVKLELSSSAQGQRYREVLRGRGRKQASA